MTFDEIATFREHVDRCSGMPDDAKAEWFRRLGTHSAYVARCVGCGRAVWVGFTGPSQCAVDGFFCPDHDPIGASLSFKIDLEEPQCL